MEYSSLNRRSPSRSDSCSSCSDSRNENERVYSQHDIEALDTDEPVCSSGVSFSNGRNGIIHDYYTYGMADYPMRDYVSNATVNFHLNRILFTIQKVFVVGPEPPSDPVYSCDHTAFLSRLDSIPFSFCKRYSLRVRMPLLVMYLMVWCVLVVSLISKNLYGAPEISGGSGDASIMQLSCRENRDFWRGKNAHCGLNAQYCLRDFRVHNDADGVVDDGDDGVLDDAIDAKQSISTIADQDIIIKCPALCDSESKIYSYITTGLEAHKYVSFVVGGGKLEDPAKYPHLVHQDQITYPYRADSFPCAAALHAGLISPVYGGVARMSFASSNDHSVVGYESRKGNHIKSIGFNSSFPYSFIFKSVSPKDSPVKISNKYDYRILITALNMAFGIPVVYLYEGYVDYIVVTTVGFWNIVLALDPPIVLDSLNPEAGSFLVSVGFKRFLPLSFVLYTLWKFVIHKTLNKSASPIGKLVFWYSLYWVSLMNNITFDKYLSVDRFIISDLMKQLGSMLTLLAVTVIAAVCIVVQAFAVWKAGNLVKYLSFYFVVLAGLALLNKLPGLTLRVHHYIFGMVLIPGTATRGFSALLFQGLLLGFIINGIARWDFASIVETDGSLRRDDPFDRIDLRPPMFNLYDPSSKVISWSTPIDSASSTLLSSNNTLLHDMSKHYDDINSAKLTGYSLLINDIERYRGYNNTIYLDKLIALNHDFGDFFKQIETVTPKDSSQADIDLYLRVARASVAHEEIVGDYTNAAVLKWPSGRFIMPKPGVT